MTDKERKWIRAVKRVMKQQPASVRLVVTRWGDSISIMRSDPDDPPFTIRTDAEVVDTIRTLFGIVTLD